MHRKAILLLTLTLTLAGCKTKLDGEYAFMVGNWKFEQRYNFATAQFETAQQIGITQDVEFKEKGKVCWSTNGASEDCSRMKFFNSSVDGNGDTHYGFDLQKNRFLEVVYLHTDTIIISGDIAASDDSNYINYYVRQ